MSNEKHENKPEKTEKRLTTREELTDFLLYTTPNGRVKVEIFVANETVWLTQERMAQLFGVQRPAITKHLKNIFESGELDEKVVSSILEHTTQHGAVEGKKQVKSVKYYNLDVIISVGYRVKSKRGTQFRQWANKMLKDYFLQAEALNQQRLEQRNEQLATLQGLNLLLTII